MAHGTAADPEVQDTDIVTRTWSATTKDGLSFEADVGDETLSFDGSDMDVEDMVISGDVSSDRSTISDAAFTYSANVSFAMDLLGVTSAEDVCDLLASFGVSCQACNDGDVLCIDVSYEGVTGSELSGTTIVELEEAP